MGSAPCLCQEAVSYHSRTAAQRKMLDFARQYLQADDDEVTMAPVWVLLGTLLGARGCVWVLWVGPFLLQPWRGGYR